MIGISFLAFALVILTPRSLRAQQSYRTQQSLRSSTISSEKQASQTAADSSRNLRASRFLGWREAAKKGPEAVRYFQRLLARAHSRSSIRSAGISTTPKLSMAVNARLRAFLASNGTASLPGIFLRPSLPTGAIPSAVVTGDFNRDGKLDWVVANAGDNSLDLYLGNGDATAQLPIIMALHGQSPVGLAAADLDGDGKLDLVIAEADSQTIGILFGNGDGTFQPEVQISLPVIPLAVAIADLNGDTHPDLLVGIVGTDTENSYFAALLNNGSGQFGAPIYAPNPTPVELVEGDELSVADVNGDGIPDVLVAGFNAEGTIVQIYLSQGGGRFAAGKVVDASNAVRDVLNAVLADVNGDGCADVMDADTSALVFIYPGDCKGDFDNATNYQVYGAGDIGFGLAVADINGDGHPDMIVTGVPGGPGGGFGTETGDTVTVRFNDGTGHFGPAQVYRGDPGMFSLAVADLQGNGHPDIIAANQNANTTTVYINNGSAGFGPPQGGYDGFEEGTPTSPSNAPDSRFIVADINGDGKPDLGLVEFADGSASELNITVMLNQGNGQFSAPIRSPAISSNPSLRIADFVFADFRKTGQLDFLAEIFDDSASSPPQLVYAQNTGNGQFGTPVQIPFTTQGDYGFGAVCVGDFNKDGNLDFAIATGTGPAGTPSQLTVFLGHGDGTFTQSFQANFGSQMGNISPYPEAAFVEDANGDGRPDIYVWLYDNTFGPGAPGGRDLYEFLGNGNGTFQPPRDILQNLSAMTMADLNHDGRLDVIDIESGSTLIAEGEPGTAPPQVNIYLGQADGSFSSPTTYAPYNGIFATSTGNNLTLSGGFPTYFGDFNADGDMDVALFQFDSLNGGPAYVQFLMGNGDGTFTPTYDVFGLGIREIPDLTVPNLFGDGRTAFLQTPNYTASYQVLPATNAPSFQIQPLETPVLGGSDSLTISLNLPSASDTILSLSVSDSGVQIPSSATIRAGQISTEVPFTLTSSVARNRWFSITAQANGETKTAYDFPGRAIDSFTQVVIPPPLNTVQQGGISEIWSAGVQSNGDTSATFQISCAALPAGASCQFQEGLQTIPVPGGGFGNTLFQISVGPSTPVGTYTFDLVFSDGQSTLTAPETLQVTPAPPPLSVNPNQLNLGMAIVGSIGPPTQTVTVTNSSTNTLAPLTITAPANAQPQIGTFSETTTCGSSLAASSSCGITITFIPNHPGTVSDQISVSFSSDVITIPLSATAADFSIQAAQGASTTVAVQAGQTAAFSLQATPDFFTGTVNLACSTPAPEAHCSVSTNSLNIASSNSVPFQVSVTTTAASIAAPRTRGTKPMMLIGILVLACCLVFSAVLIARVSSASRQPAAISCVFLVVLVAGALALASCAGKGNNNGGGGGNNGTTPGTYPVTVSGVGDNTTRTLQLSLVVQ